MDVSQIFNFMVPKDRRFFPLFVQATDNLVETSELLLKLLGETEIENRTIHVNAIRMAEHKGDDITRNLLDELNGTFITPFDREDIHELISNIDSIVDLIHTTSKRIYLYKLAHYPQEFIKVAECVHSASKEIQHVFHHVKSASDFQKFQESFSKIRLLEQKADDLYQQFVMDLFDKEENAILLIKKRDILIALEKAMDKCDDVSDIFLAIIVKIG